MDTIIEIQMSPELNELILNTLPVVKPRSFWNIYYWNLCSQEVWLDLYKDILSPLEPILENNIEIRTEVTVDHINGLKISFKLVVK